MHVNNPPIQNKAKKCFENEKKKFKKVICIHTSNYCNLLRRNHDLRIFQKKFLHTFPQGKFFVDCWLLLQFKKKTKKIPTVIYYNYILCMINITYKLQMKKKNISRPPIPHIFFLQKQNKTKIKLTTTTTVLKNEK